MYCMSTVWKYTDELVKQYVCTLDVYLMSVLSYLYGIIMDHKINSTRYGNNFVDGLNATLKSYLREQMEF